MRSREARVCKSPLSVADVRELFSRIPGYASTLEELDGALELYEIHIAKAVAITGYDEFAELSF